MLFKTLLIFGLCVGLTYARLLNTYKSQTYIQVTVQPTNPIRLCVCEGAKCRLDNVTSSKICSQVYKQFEDNVHPNPNFFQCQVHPNTCTYNSNKPSPDKIDVDLYFDHYYLTTSHIWMGPDGFKRAIATMFSAMNFSGSSNGTMNVVRTKTKIGELGMPVEFSGRLTIPTQTAEEYSHCIQDSCIHFVNKFCDDVTTSFQSAGHPFMQYFLGCYIRRIYTASSQARIDWSLLFDYRKLAQTRVFTTRKQLQDIARRFILTTRPTPYLMEFSFHRAIPLDYCILLAQTVTTQTYHEDFMNALSMHTRISVDDYFGNFAEQLAAADDQNPTCLRKMVEPKFTRAGTYTKFDMNLWVSGTCFKKQGLRTCNEIRYHIYRQWQKGSQIAHNPVTPLYSFTLIGQGLLLDE